MARVQMEANSQLAGINKTCAINIFVDLSSAFTSFVRFALFENVVEYMEFTTLVFANGLKLTERRNMCLNKL